MKVEKITTTTVEYRVTCEVCGYSWTTKMDPKEGAQCHGCYERDRRNSTFRAVSHVLGWRVVAFMIGGDSGNDLVSVMLESDDGRREAIVARWHEDCCELDVGDPRPGIYMSQEEVKP